MLKWANGWSDCIHSSLHPFKINETQVIKFPIATQHSSIIKQIYILLYIQYRRSLATTKSHTNSSTCTTLISRATNNQINHIANKIKILLRIYQCCSFPLVFFSSNKLYPWMDIMYCIRSVYLIGCLYGCYFILVSIFWVWDDDQWWVVHTQPT